MYKMELKQFLKYQNQDLEMYNPVVENVFAPVYLEDKLIENAEDKFGLLKYTCYDDKLKEFVEHIYAYKTTQQYGFELIEVVRRFETYPTIWRKALYTLGSYSGFHAIFQSCGVQYWYAMNETNEWQFVGEYIEDKLANLFAHECNFIENIIAQDTKLVYCSYDNNSHVNILEYIKAYRKYPLAEITMKLGLYRLSTNEKALKTITENKTFRKWLYANAEECKGRAFQTIFNAYKKNPNGRVSDYYNSLMFRIECGKQVSGRNRDLYSQVLKHTTQEKLYAYFEKQHIASYTYYDYLEACIWLRLNLDDTKVLFPHNFMEMHDNYTTQYHEYQMEQERIRIEAKEKEAAERSKIVASRMYEIADKYQCLELVSDNFALVIARSKIDLIEESSVLKHCVGRLNYDKRQADEKSLICFVRKVEDLETPYVTLELSLKDYKVLQCYGMNNSKVVEVEDFVNAWQGNIRNILKTNRIGAYA